jgi:hypothetical protein
MIPIWTDGLVRHGATCLLLPATHTCCPRAAPQVRFEAYQPGGPMAKVLSENPTVLVVNDTVFVHGGLTMQHSRWHGWRQRCLHSMSCTQQLLHSAAPGRCCRALTHC